MYVRCTHCGHDNSPEYRFCGMCGAPLAHPSTEHPPTEVAPHQAWPSGPSDGEAGDGEKDNVHARSFSRIAEDPTAEFHYLYEDEPPRSHVSVVVFLLIIFGAAGFLEWQWRHGGFPFSQPTNSQQPSNASQTKQSAPPSEVAPAANQNQSGQETANRSPAPPEAENKTAETRQNPPTPAKANPPVPAKPRGSSITSARSVASKAAPAANPVASTAPDANLEQSGERYLYGNGVPQSCTRAESNLGTAATHGNTKAQTVLGTMYATGHCVGRDLPAAYRWFARALHHDPQNSRIAQDLQVLWRQMTPQERQLATAS